MFIDNWLIITLIVLLPFLSFGIIPLLKKMGDKSIAWITVLLSGLVALFVFLLIPDIYATGADPITAQYNWVPTIGLTFDIHIDALAIFMAAIASGIGFLVVLYSTKYMEGEKGLPRYYALIMLFIGAMICLVITDNLLIVYFFWEIVGLCSYALISFNVQDPSAAKAGIKAFVTTRIGDIGLIIGIFILYLGFQTFSIQDIITTLTNADTVAFNDLMVYVAPAGFFFILGAMGKSAQIPLHAWLPDAMEAPTTVSALIHAATMVNAGIYILARMAPVFVYVNGWPTTLLYLGGITALVAAIMAVVEPDLKRLLAYSTISQLGYMVFAIGLVLNLGNGAVDLQGVFISQYHLLNHSVFKALLFLCAGAIIHSVGTRNMYEMRGLKKEMPKTRWLMLIGVLALAGVPIFSGFWSKDMIFAGALEHELWIPLALVVITGVLTFAYSLRMYFLVFEGEGNRKHAVHETPNVMLIVLAILAVGALASWILIQTFSMGFEVFGLGTHTHYLGDFVSETFTSAAFGLTVLALGLGFVLYWFRNSLKNNMISQWIIKWGRTGFGFDRLYNNIAVGVKEVALKLRRFQTGDANLNFIGIVLLLIIVLIMLAYQGVF
ncbi:MAG: NADH-quinone oxidoreductase subunit L [Thermoplasmata archaeon]|nr:NADH-quinone oxidoreductase subunit L [Thermoplasmata archaeon]